MAADFFTKLNSPGNSGLTWGRFRMLLEETKIQMINLYRINQAV